MSKKVAIIWRYLPDYRLPFYTGLREYLALRDIDLKVIYGPTRGMGPIDEEKISPWAKCVPHWSVSVGSVELCWQPYATYIRDADLVIVEQANRLLLNYWLIARRFFNRQKIAFWGHGRDLQSVSNSIRNQWKRFFVKHVDWWFAYSADVKEGIISSAFPAKKITNVQNATDTDTLRTAKAEMSKQQLAKLKKEVGLGTGPVGIYCGRLYKDKRVEFLLEACFGIKKNLPTFEVIIVGGGPDQGKVISASQQANWIHYVGPKFGTARVPYFLLSDLSLVPGAVGLVVIDCFALEVPLITTNFPYHGPEIAYLRDGENGLVTENDLESYVSGVTGLLMEPQRLQRLKSGCREAASIYTVEAMIENFGNGVVACLQT